VITERLSFRAKYGHGDELVGLLKETFEGMAVAGGAIGGRIYTDATGPMFSVIAEIDYPDMAAWLKGASTDTEQYATAQFQEWFGRMQQITESGERQLLNCEKLL
jgi:hypothetical protein